ncbi:MAG: hypothetical protein WDW38_009526 [Sanguina aurantia]
MLLGVAADCDGGTPEAWSQPTDAYRGLLLTAHRAGTPSHRRLVSSHAYDSHSHCAWVAPGWAPVVGAT